MIVWVTRDEPDDGPLSQSLRREGLEPIVLSVIRRRRIDDAAEPLQQLSPSDWLVLTSVFAVECLSRWAAGVPQTAVISDATARAARACGMRVELVARQPAVSALFAELATRIGPRRVTVCYPRSSLASAAPEMQANVRIISPVVYETVQVAFDRAILDRVDCMAVTSASAVRAIGPVRLKAASIGPSTTMALLELGTTPWVQAAEPSFESLARAIADQARSSRHQRA